MTSQCIAPIKAQVMRITRLDQCGLPVTGASSAQVTSDSFVSIKNTPSWEDGKHYMLKKANAQPCVNEKDPSFLNWLEQEIELCTLDQDMIITVSGERLLSTSTTGTGVAAGEGLLTARYSMEVWQPTPGCTPSGLPLYVYWAFANCFDAKIQDFTFIDDVFTYKWKNFTKRANVGWNIASTGANWLPAGFQFTGTEHWAFNVTSVAPPTASCGAVLI